MLVEKHDGMVVTADSAAYQYSCDNHPHSPKG